MRKFSEGLPTFANTHGRSFAGEFISLEGMAGCGDMECLQKLLESSTCWMGCHCIE